ncbi:MAG: hypothetical protein ACPGPE_05130, partial [Planctomycetota bacterium]
MGTDEAAGTWGEATSGSGNQRKDALLVFLSTLCVALVGLLALIRTSPGWFGLEPQGPGGESLAPRMKAVGPADVPRPVAERAWRAPTLAQSIFADASPSVVHVTTRSRDVEGNEFDAAEFVSGTGSGWTWDQTGHVVTCLHVVNGA